MILDKSIKEIKGSVKLIKELADLYYNTFNERMTLGCSACYEKAYYRLTQKLNILRDNKEVKEKDFVLKVDSIREFGSSKTYTNYDLTNEVAISYIKTNINRLKQFSKYPENIEELLNPSIKKEASKEVKNEPKKRGRKPSKNK